MGPQAWAPRHVSASTSNIWCAASVTNGRINGTNCGWLTMIPSLRKPKLSGLAHAGEGESVLLLHGAEPDGKPVRETQFTVPS